MSHGELPSRTLPSPEWSPSRAAAIRRIARVFYGLAGPIQVAGVQRVPPKGAHVLVFNHMSNFDPHLILSVVPRADIAGLVAAEYSERPLPRLLVTWAGGIWLRRGVGDRTALRKALELLERGWIVGIAPEGRRSPHHALAPGRHGAAFLALRAGVPLLPVGLTGTEKIGRSLLHLRRSETSIRFGEPFRLSTDGARSRKDAFRMGTAEIMRRIAGLLPPLYRGSYSPNEAPERGSRRRGLAQSG